jgi:starch-binding outer membrane protein, SusD/RagB family
MKTNILIYLLSGTMLFISCSKDFYDEKDPNKITSANFWQTEADLNSAVASVYGTAGGGLYGCFGGLGTLPNFGCRAGEFNYYQSDANFEIFSNDPNTAITSSLWGSDYQGIFYANQIIKYGGDMDVAASIKNKYVAEAKFMRGVFYLNLVSGWGEVPIINKLPTTPEDYYKAKSSKDSVWLQVVNDFTESANDLPETRSGSELGRATKGAALAFLGRAYLYQSNYDKTVEVLQSVVDKASDYNYALLDSFAWLFDGQHENSQEAVFEIQYKNINGSGYSLMSKILATSEVGGWAAVGDPDPALLDSFLRERTTTNDYDPRATTTFAWNYPGCMYYQHQFSTSFDVTKIFVKKYTDWWNADQNDEKSDLDTYAMRYADVLLMLAEAYTMQGNISAAAPLVQRIRTRAKLANIESAMISSYTQAQMMTEIRHQRKLEFCLEWLSFYDLRRWGLLKDAIANSTNIYKDRYLNTYPKYDYFPIPQNELAANKNLTQNDAWK